MGNLLILVGLLGMFAGFVSLIIPLKFLRIESRKAGALILFVGFVVATIGGGMVGGQQTVPADPAGAPATIESTPAPATPDASQPDKTQNVKILERKMLNQAFILSLQVDEGADIWPIAKEYVAQYKDEHDHIRVFFFAPGQIPGTDVPKHRITWTSWEGFKQDY